MLSFRYPPRLLAVAVVLALVAGCGSSSGRSTVEGSVKYDGQPVDQGGIVFVPEGQGAAADLVKATGIIEDGRYKFESQRGPKPGKYRVEITWQKKTGEKVAGGEGQLREKTQQALPAKYNEKSELIREVKSGSNTLDFDLAK